jgi:hypothetical protein
VESYWAKTWKACKGKSTQLTVLASNYTFFEFGLTYQKACEQYAKQQFGAGGGDSVAGSDYNKQATYRIVSPPLVRTILKP